eukprot:scaffold128_cov328-Pavlova_lutheri.AAC.7
MVARPKETLPKGEGIHIGHLWISSSRWIHDAGAAGPFRADPEAEVGVGGSRMNAPASEGFACCLSEAETWPVPVSCLPSRTEKGAPSRQLCRPEVESD